MEVMPDVVGPFYNGCSEPCDMLVGPCACGTWHRREDWSEETWLAAVAASVLES